MTSAYPPQPDIWYFLFPAFSLGCTVPICIMIMGEKSCAMINPRAAKLNDVTARLNLICILSLHYHIGEQNRSFQYLSLQHIDSLDAIRVSLASRDRSLLVSPSRFFHLYKRPSHACLCSSHHGSLGEGVRFIDRFSMPKNGGLC